jgi:hypothetical protein
MAYATTLKTNPRALPYPEGMTNEDLKHIHERFSHREQQQAARDVVQNHLADDRDQNECRYLMRFSWQLAMGYQEVTLRELEEHLSPENHAIILELLHATQTGYAAIDAWIARYGTLPVVQDRGHALQHQDHHKNRSIEA